MASLKNLEATFHEAFNHAQQARQAGGLKPLPATMRKARDGSPRIGLEAYKVSLWLRPWHYADLLRLKERTRAPSIYKLLTTLIENALPNRELAAKPDARAARTERLKLRSNAHKPGALRRVAA